MTVHYSKYGLLHVECGLKGVTTFSDGRYKQFLSHTNIKDIVTCKNCLKKLKGKEDRQSSKDMLQ